MLQALHKAMQESQPPVSQAELAAKIGVSTGMVWQMLHEHRPVPSDKVIPICAALDWRVTPIDLRPDLYTQLMSDAMVAAGREEAAQACADSDDDDHGPRGSHGDVANGREKFAGLRE